MPRDLSTGDIPGGTTVQHVVRTGREQCRVREANETPEPQVTPTVKKDHVSIVDATGGP